MATDEAAEIAIELVNGYWNTQLVVTAVELGLPDLIRDGPLGTDELAALSRSDRPTVARLLRALDAIGVCRRVAPDVWATTPLGRALESEHPGGAASRARLVGRTFYSSWGGLLDSVRSGRPAVETITGQRWIDHISGRADIASVFDCTMDAVAVGVARDLLASYDLPLSGTFVDVGGGTGGLLTTLLLARTSCSGVVLDLPTVVGRTRESLTSRGVADRCVAVGGDFFAEVPGGGDVYLLSFVLHDWPDDRAVDILRRCRDAMGPDARLLVVEMVVPVGSSPPLPALYDVHMLAVTGGRERTEDEYAALFDRAGLLHTATITTPGPRMVLEARSDPAWLHSAAPIDRMPSCT